MILDHVKIVSEARLDNSNVLTLTLNEVSWPQSSDAFHLDGIAYKYISAGSSTQGFENLLATVNRSTYSADVYAGLESFFKNGGRLDWAEETYIARNRRERATIIKNHGWSIDAIGNLFLDYFVGYGRKAWRAVVWSLVVVTIGSLVF